MPGLLSSVRHNATEYLPYSSSIGRTPTRRETASLAPYPGGSKPRALCPHVVVVVKTVSPQYARCYMAEISPTLFTLISTRVSTSARREMRSAVLLLLRHPAELATLFALGVSQMVLLLVR